MNMEEIIKDSLRYPFSDKKNLLIYGIISLIVIILTIEELIIPFLFIIGYLIGFIALGYSFKIISASLNNTTKLPDFNSWTSMFKDGIKVLIVAIVYFLPAILILLIVNIIFSPSNIIGILSVLISGSSIGGSILPLFEIGPEIIIIVLYTIILIPIFLMSVAHMANNNGKLEAAFKFREIINKISSNGWINLSAWYMLTILVVLVIYEIGIFVINISGLINPYLGIILISLILVPYVSIFTSRSTALFYNGLNLHTSGKYFLAIIVLLLTFLVLSFSVGNITNIGGSNTIKPYNSTTNTFSGSGVSFNFPSNWNVQTNYGSQTDISLYNEDNNSNDIQNPLYELSIIPNPIGLSDQDSLESLQNMQTQTGSQEISNKTIEVDNNTAYEYVYIINDPSIFPVTMTDQEIGFVKNGTTYIMDFMAPSTDFNNEKQNFNIILNTLKIK
ncbi:MAG: DUF4013 domain-containing protein [Methanobacterium sp.]|uniref:DUF4013 domain-containing protein n=1 Tax=Methanobacterium sp. TaxID=2164 RepID=UPI003C748EF5